MGKMIKVSKNWLFLACHLSLNLEKTATFKGVRSYCSISEYGFDC